MSTETVTIAGKPFELPCPYAEGHTLTAGEASALNQVLHENVRNNMAKKVETGTAGQAEIDAYVQNYQFGVRTGGGGARRDPVQARAIEIAVTKVKAGLKKQGKNLNAYTSAQFTEAGKTALKAHPEWVELARQQVEMEGAIESDIDVSGMVPAAKSETSKVDDAAAQPQG